MINDISIFIFYLLFFYCLLILVILLAYKIVTTQMRNGGQNADNGWLGLYNDEGGVDYHEVLWPHWCEFAAALKQYRPGGPRWEYWNDIAGNNGCYHLDLYGIELPLKVQCLLWDALSRTDGRMTELDFHYHTSYFDSDIAPFAVGLLGSHPHVQKFELVYDRLNAKGSEILGEIIRDHPSIVEINLQGTIHGREGYDLISSLVQSGLKKIRLGYCSICSNGSTDLSDILAANTTTESIDVCGTKLNDNDAIGIAAAMATNTKLGHLSIDAYSKSCITEEGRSALRDVCFDMSSLGSAANSNHTCRINGYQALSNCDNHNGGRGQFKENRQMKIYHVLASRNKDMTNCKDLANADIKLLPMILMSVKRYSEASAGPDRVQSDETKAFMRVNINVKPISIMYELLRNWDEVQILFKSRASNTLSKRQKCK